MKYTSLLIICISLISCSKPSKKNNLESELDNLFSKEFTNEENPGGSLLLKKGDTTIYMNSYGVADINTKEKITENTIFNTGSISKTFVSNSILILNERDSLSLNDNLNMHFNDFKNKELASKVKIKHMLSHTSGLPDLRFSRFKNYEEFYDFYLTAKDKENFQPLKEADSLNFEAGAKFEYSNPSYNGLALIIEQKVGKPWQEFVKENIFKPSVMTQSKITNGSYPESGVAHAYDNYYQTLYNEVRGDYYEYDYGEFTTFTAAGNGGIWSSVLDLAKYEKALKKGTFLSKEMILKSRKVFKPNNWSSSQAPYIGYSWFTSQENLFRNQKSFDVNFVYHTGSQGGFRSFYITIPEKDILFIGLFNRPLSDFNKLVYDTMLILEKNNWLEKNN